MGTKMFATNQSSKEQKLTELLKFWLPLGKIKIFSKICMMCINFRNLPNFEAIRPILFLDGQQYHPIR
jgi:hypothetical protein